MCRKKLEEGVEVLELQEAIVGMSSIVPLNGASLFCSFECLKEYFNGSKAMLHMRRRIP